MAHRRTFTAVELQYLLLIAALPILGYQFGLGNQVEQFTLVRRLSDPGFLTNDFYVNSAAGFGPRYYYSVFLSWLTNAASLPVVTFVLTFMTNFALGAISYDAVQRHLGASRVAAAISALLVVTNSSFSLGLAGFLRFESFQPANPAIVLALLGLTTLISGARMWSVVCLVLAALVHPLIGVEVAAIGFAACGIAELMRTQSRAAGLAVLRRYLVPGSAFCAAMFVAWKIPSFGRPAARIADADFFHILAQFRAPHHYLAQTFPAVHYLTAAAFVVALAYLYRQQRREHAAGFSANALAICAAISVGMCAASVVMVDMLESRTFMTAQLFRMLLVLKWVGMLYFARAASQWIAQGGALHWIAAMAPVLVTGEAQPILMVVAIAAVELARRRRLSDGQEYLAAMLLAAFSIALAMKAGTREEMVRAVAGAIAGWLYYAPPIGRPIHRSLAAALIACLIAFGWLNRDRHYLNIDAFKPTYTWNDLQGADADVARWVRLHTPANSVWLTPPDFESFRLVAERAIVADFTSIPFDDLAIREWQTRMSTLYGNVQSGGFAALAEMDHNYRIADPARLRLIGRQFGASYAVIYATSPWPGPVLYRNATYMVIRLTA